MARYVLLAFENDDDANAFVAMIPMSGGPIDRDGSSSRMFVRGVFKKPTQYCECQPQPEKQVRGKKWGWWICATCGKPKKNSWQMPHNLLDKEDVGARERNVFFHIIEPSSPVRNDNVSR